LVEQRENEERHSEELLEVNSFIEWDIIAFFYNNPYSNLTANGISIALGRSLSKIEVDLPILVQKGILTKNFLGENKEIVTYSYTKNKEIHRKIESFMTGCDTPEGLMKIINRILNQGKHLRKVAKDE
jgi:hypothetical protein